VLKEVGKLNLFAVSPIDATIQDGGKRKRSDGHMTSSSSNKIKSKIIKNKNKSSLEKINKILEKSLKFYYLNLSLNLTFKLGQMLSLYLFSHFKFKHLITAIS